MKNRFVRDFILNNIISKIRKRRLNIDIPNNHSKTYNRLFNSLDKEEQEEIIIRIIQSQSRAIRYAIENNKKIELRYLGSFLVKPKRGIVLKLRSEVIKELGYDKWSNLTPDEKSKVNEIVDSRKVQRIEQWKEDRRINKPRGKNIGIKCIFIDKLPNGIKKQNNK